MHLGIQSDDVYAALNVQWRQPIRVVFVQPCNKLVLSWATTHLSLLHPLEAGMTFFRFFPEFQFFYFLTDRFLIRLNPGEILEEGVVDCRATC